MATIHITNQAQLAAMTDGNTYILDNDITLNNWQTIPDTGDPFAELSNITLNGNGHALNNLTQPLISELVNGTVENLTLGANINDEYSDVGAVARGASGIIRNVTVNGSIQGSTHVGGLVGQLNNPSSIVLENNVNNAAVTAEEAVGGIIGTVNYDATITGNINRGTITGSLYVGGIAGWLVNTLNAAVTGNENEGSIIGGHDVGGIVGYAITGTISNNIDRANVTGDGEAGGIAGNISNQFGFFTGRTVEVTNNKVYCGTVTVRGKTAGGIVGYDNASGPGPANIIADNMMYATAVTSVAYVGRIVGFSPDYDRALTGVRDNFASYNTILTGNNTSLGGFNYSGTVVDVNDPQYGRDLPQGENIYCRDGYYMDNCAGICVRDGDNAVSFDSNGGSAVPSQDIPPGGTAAMPSPNPTRGCDIFDGWYSDPGLTQAYDFSTPVTGDITLYAKWIPQDCPPEPPVPPKPFCCKPGGWKCPVKNCEK